MAIAVINQITERLVRGTDSSVDALTFTALSIVQVGLKSSTRDFNLAVDYKLVDGNVDWSPPGKEPTAGQSYFVTYTFQAPSSIKNFDQISDEMDVNMRALQPAATTQLGSVTRNLFIDLPATEITSLYSAVQRVASIQSLNNLADFQGTELDDYGNDHSIVREGATASTGMVTFGASSVATEAILIPVGTRVSTLSTTTQAAIYFQTAQDGTILPGQSTVTIPIEAEEVGAVGNVGTSVITIVSVPILGVSTVINQNPTTGGQDQESDEDYRDRIKAGFLANDATTLRGIRRRAVEITNVIDALVVGAGDPLLVRGGGGGGKVDLYVQAESGIGRSRSEDQVYASVDLVFQRQPVLSVSEVLVNGVLLDPSNWLFIKDAGVLTESVQAQDALRILGGAVNNDVVTISYIYNGVLEDVQNFFAVDEENSVPSRDFLSRMATETFIDVGCTVRAAEGYEPKVVENGVVDVVASHIDGLKLGAEIKYQTIYDLIGSVEGVDDLLPLDALSVRGKASAKTIKLARNEFPQTGSVLVKFMS